MTTARDIVKKALQKIGALTKNDDMSGDEASDSLFALNSLLGSWSNENLIIFTQPLEQFSLISGQSTYTMGAGGDFDTQRPSKLINVFVRQGGIDYDLGIINEDKFDDITYKSLQGIPEWVSTSNNFPLTTLKFYPVPTGGIDVFIRSEKPTTKLTTLDSVLSLPDGWDRALIYNLALELSPDYGQPVTQELYQLALNSKGAIKSASARNRSMDAYPSTPTVNTINSGYYR